MTMNTEQPVVAAGPTLSVKDLRIRTADKELVHGVSFEIAAGERVGLIGASGSGKTLTCMSVAGLLGDGIRAGASGLTATGSIRLAGVDHDLVGASENQLAIIRGRRSGMVFQEPMTALNPVMRVGHQVAETIRSHRLADRREARTRAVHLLASTGLPDPEGVARSFPHQLSGGQQQRVVLAIALANNPSLLICDEPTTALDVTVQARVLDLIAERAAEVGASLFFISHDLAVVSSICDRVIVMFGGEIIEEGSVLDVLQNPTHPHTRRLMADAELAPRRLKNEVLHG